MSRNHFSLWGAAASNPSLVTLIRELQSGLSDCRTVLDVGCGNASPLKFLRALHLTGLDGYPPALEAARRTGTHDDYVSGNVVELGKLFKPGQFDACIALDVIEHLPKEAGWQMLAEMERIARRKVIILTPNGFLPQKSHDGDLQEHLSGWTASELRSKGYEVVGMYGLKSLRGEYHQIKGRPRVFWLVVSLLSHYLHTRSRPEKSSAILCLKKLGAR